MKKFALFLLLAVAILTGCVTTTSTPYRNDVLVQDQYVLTRSNAFTDSTTSIRFYLRNYGRDTVPKAVVSFFDPSGLSVNSLTCQGGFQTDDHTCEYDNIASLDNRYFAITLNTPSSDRIKAPTDFQIKYKISFDYSGFRRIVVPVTEDPSIPPTIKYSISDPSVGPIAVDFEPPVGAITKQGNQQIKEYWGVAGDSFDVKMNFKQVVQTNEVTNITGDNIQLTLQGLDVDSQSKCDFDSGLHGKFTVSVGQSTTSMVCSFRARSFSGPQTSTTIDINFAYTFSTIKIETITVTPRQAEGGTSGSNEGGGNAGGGIV